jgi:biotin transport system substrate-specific component
MQASRTRTISLCGLAIALLAVGANIWLPIGPVPFTLQTMMVLLLMLVLTPRESVIAVGGYLVLGALGLPVGAGFKGGIAWIVGPTAGFLYGFLLAAVLIALLRWGMAKYLATRDAARETTLAAARENGRGNATGGVRELNSELNSELNRDAGSLSAVAQKRRASIFDILVLPVLAAIIVMAASYTCGVAWFCFATGSTLPAALVACVVPFVVPDLIKLAAAIVCARPITAVLNREQWVKQRG